MAFDGITVAAVAKELETMLTAFSDAAMEQRQEET